MRKPFLIAAILTASISATAFAASTIPLRSDMSVAMAASKESVKKQILYTVTVKNNGENEARDVILSMTTPPGLDIVTMEKGAFDSCSRVTVTEGLVAIRCKKEALPLNGTATLTMRVGNPTDGGGEASAQVFNMVPDHVPANNFATVTTQ